MEDKYSVSEDCCFCIPIQCSVYFIFLELLAEIVFSIRNIFWFSEVLEEQKEFTEQIRSIKLPEKLQNLTLEKRLEILGREKRFKNYVKVSLSINVVLFIVLVYVFMIIFRFVFMKMNSTSVHRFHLVYATNALIIKSIFTYIPSAILCS